MLSLLITISILLFLVAVSGYVFATAKENINFANQTVEIDSKAVTQQVLDSLDYTVFKLGETRLKIGDEIKVHVTKDSPVKGTLLGAKKNSNTLCLVTKDDQVVELNVRKIKKLKVLTKYGRLL